MDVPEWSGNARLQIRNARAADCLPVLVVISTGPGSTDQIHSVTSAEIDALVTEFACAPRGFVIDINKITSSANHKISLVAISRNVKQAAQRSGVCYELVLELDQSYYSPLFSHSLVLDTIQTASSFNNVWIFLPSQPYSGHVTVNGVYHHIPPHSSSSLSSSKHKLDIADWLTANLHSTPTIQTITIDQLRKGGPTAVSKRLLDFTCTITNDTSRHTPLILIVDALSQADVDVFVAGYLLAITLPQQHISSSSPTTSSITTTTSLLSTPASSSSSISSLSSSTSSTSNNNSNNNQLCSSSAILSSSSTIAPTEKNNDIHFFCFSSPSYIFSRLSLDPPSSTANTATTTQSTKLSSPPYISTTSSSPKEQ